MASVLGGGTFTREGEQRVFAYAMLASIVLHAVLLFAGILHRDPNRRPNPAPGPIVARLVAPRPVAAPAPAAEPPKPHVEELPQPARKPRFAPAPVAKAAPKAPVVPATPAPTAPASEAPKPVSESAPPAAPSAPASVPSSAPPSPGQVAKVDPQPAPTAPAEIADKGNLDQYRLAIYDAARKYKKYPRVALDNNWEGKAVIRLVIGANGMISSISIKTGTGHEVLDQAALDTLRKAKPLVPIPAGLRGREFGIDINFIYSLKDESA
jgi:protein TonB